MHEQSCFCGAVFTSEDFDALVRIMHGHLAEAHDLDLPKQSARNYMAAERRLTGPSERLEEIGEVEVRPVDPSMVDEVLTFFDRDAFVGNPGWGSCYCLFHHLLGDITQDDWNARPWEDNRAALAERIGGGATTGVVAVVDGRMVGWCNASVRRAYPAHVEGTDDDDTTGSIVCFLVAPPYRGHGIARHMLGGAVELLGDLGLSAAEGYPVEAPENADKAYRGTPSLFESAGFFPTGDGVYRRDL